MTNEELNKLPKKLTTDMESPKTDLQIEAIDQTYESLFDQITKLDSGDVIIKGDCKFCNHPARIEAEQAYEKGNRTSYAIVLKFFKDWEKAHPDSGLPPMNNQNIRVHLLNHYLQQEKRIWMREYTDNLKSVMNYKIDQSRKFEMLASALQMKFCEIGADPTIDNVKQADIMTKLSKSMIEIILTQAKLRGEMQVINVVVDKFQSVWVQMVNNQRDEDTRRVLLEGLESFQSQLEGTVLPES